ncbi:HNH endonuclease [Saccharospirillum sp.]|uniref:HNH endonuclease n=1 Tax=Saccharospirillum sp. TaxID=2033801 RepID=UPI0034A09BBA
MTPLQRALVEKAGNDHGFEYVLPANDHTVKLASARHRVQVCISAIDGQYTLSFTSPASTLLSAELARSLPALRRSADSFVAPDQVALTQVLRRAAELAHALPNQAVRDFEASLTQELTQLPEELKNTEVERLVRQRIGQQAFRSAMVDYWDGACAVTGIALSEVLRASHAKPWAACDSDTERLDVFNGFLLSANLDALFDRFLISFSDAGTLLLSPRITPDTQARLGLTQPLCLRWLAEEHQPYLNYHRNRFGALM